MNLSDYKNITKFLKDNPDFIFNVGEVGFGRPCVGILHKQNYVAYEISEDETFATIAESKAAMECAPENAYHKGPYLSVLMNSVDSDLGPSDHDKASALKELDTWLGGIIKAGYKTQEYLESTHSINTLFGKRDTFLAVVDK